VTGDRVDESDRALSAPVLGDLTYREIHAIVDGLYVGARGLDRRAAGEDYVDERHYWRAGWLLGSWLR